VSDLRRADLHAASKEHFRKAQPPHSNGYRANHGIGGGVASPWSLELLFTISAFLQIVLEKLLPQHICSCCLLDLSQAIAFRQRCLKTHEVLHQGSTTHSSPSSSSYSRVPKGNVEEQRLNGDPLFKQEVQEDTSDADDDKEFLDEDKEFLVDLKPVIKLPQSHCTLHRRIFF